jgi:hypothetical protein
MTALALLLSRTADALWKVAANYRPSGSGDLAHAEIEAAILRFASSTAPAGP